MNYAKIAKHNLHFIPYIIDQIGEHDIIYDCNFLVWKSTKKRLFVECTVYL